jgi:hypothetical protein
MANHDHPHVLHQGVLAGLQVIVPSLPSVPVKPVILKGQEEYALFDNLKHFPNVLGTSIYRDMEHLLAVLDAEVIAPAEALATRLRPAPRHA